MKIINQKLNLDITDTLTHRRFPFTLDEPFDKLVIHLAYDPRLVPTEIGKNLAIECVDRDLPAGVFDEATRADVKTSTIENFITVSLLHEGNFVGDYHNKNNNQEIIVSKEKSSLGYKKLEILPGSYELVLSMHSCNCPVEVDLSLEAINE